MMQAPQTVTVVDDNRRGFKIMNLRDYEAIPKAKRPKLYDGEAVAKKGKATKE